MIKAASHIVQRQILDIEIAEQEKASDLQDRIARVYHAQVVPWIDKILSSFNLGNETLRIDSLQVDIGNLEENNLEESFLRQLKPQLEEILTQIVYKSKENQTQEGVEIVPVKSNELQRVDVFYFYLKAGCYPWWVESKDQKLEQLITQFTNQEWSTTSQKERFTQLVNDEHARRRMIDLIPLTSLKIIFEKVDQTISRIVFDIQKDIVQCLDVVYAGQSLKNKLVFNSFDKLVNDFFGKNKINASSKNISEYASQFLILLFQSNKTSLIAKKEVIQKIENLSQSDLQILDKSDLIAKLKTKPFINTIDDKLISTSINQIDIVEKIEVKNAGIILLWPYLRLFFEELGLLKNIEFKNDEAKWKAIALLSFLSTGEEKAEEHEIGLLKILCNLSLTEFVPTHFELTDTEQKECVNLLEAVVKNWSVLKNTSIEGLRQSFIQRDGILEKKPEDWLISIERKAHDILLDRLNWSISNIKLPWNDYLIQVKW
jgi:contractile injection system tape measure protein